MSKCQSTRITRQVSAPVYKSCEAGTLEWNQGLFLKGRHGEKHSSDCAALPFEEIVEFKDIYYAWSELSLFELPKSLRIKFFLQGPLNERASMSKVSLSRERSQKNSVKVLLYCSEASSKDWRKLMTTMKIMNIYHAVDHCPKGNKRDSASWEILCQTEQNTWKSISWSLVEATFRWMNLKTLQ